MFKGKHLFSGNDTQKIALAVEKKIEDPSTQVDAVTGATLTSNGVTEMFHADKGGLQPYVKFLNSNNILIFRTIRIWIYSQNKIERCSAIR